MNNNFLPYGHQCIGEDDIAAVVTTLRSEWLTTGPQVEIFERDICAFIDPSYQAIAVANGTAALHIAMLALGIKAGDEVIVPTITFVASANCVLYVGAKPVLVDVDKDTLLIDPIKVEQAITPHTKAIIAVDYAGQACDWNSLSAIAKKHNLFLVADACHSLGGKYQDKNSGTLADITVFSFHPVKHITTGEGGMCVTKDNELAKKMRTLRSHGISSDARSREQAGSWFYEMTTLGYNYRISDIQCALGISQLKKLAPWIDLRNQLAKHYCKLLDNSPIIPLHKREDVLHAYHLFVVRHPKRNQAYLDLRTANIGANVHYIPVHLHPYYQQNLGTKLGQCPIAEQAYSQILSLPIFPSMTTDDVERVCQVLLKQA